MKNSETQRRNKEVSDLVNRLYDKFYVSPKTMESNQSKLTIKKPIKMNVSSREAMRNLERATKSFGTLSTPEAASKKSSSGWDQSKSTALRKKRGEDTSFLSRASGHGRTNTPSKMAKYDHNKVMAMRKQRGESVFSGPGPSRAISQPNLEPYNPAKAQRLRDEQEKKKQEKNKVHQTQHQTQRPAAPVVKSKMSTGYNPRLAAEARKNLKRTQMTDWGFDSMMKAMRKS